MKRRKFKIYAEVNYNGSKDHKLLTNRGFITGDINSINDCFNQVNEDIKESIIAIQSAAAFFNVTYTIDGYEVAVTGEDDIIIESIRYTNEEELDKTLSLINSLLD